MGKLIDQLIASGDMGLYVDLRTGSYRDITGTCTATLTGTPCWRMTRAGRGLFYGLNTPAPSYIGYGDPAALQIQALTLFGAMVPMDYHIFNYVVGRGVTLDREMLYVWTDGTVRAYGNGGFVYNSGITVPLDSPFFVAWSNQFPGNNRFCVNGVFSPQAVTSNALAVAGVWGMAGRKNAASSAGSENTEGTVLLGGVVKRCLTDAEMDQLYREWRAEGWPGRYPRRNFSFPYPSKLPAEYVAQGIVLDANMGRNGNVCPNLAPTPYSGAIVGPADQTREAVFESGVRFQNSSYTSYGDITELNNATAFTVSFWMRWGGPDISYIWERINGGSTEGTMLYTIGSQARFAIAGGAAAKEVSPNMAFRVGQWYHVACVFNGLGAGDLDRAKVYFDASNQTLTVLSTPIPANAGNPAGKTFVLNTRLPALSYPSAGTFGGLRVFTRALTQGEITREYLLGARLPLVVERGEDAPVSIQTLSSGPVPDTDLVINAGTWSVSEDATVLDRRVIRTAGNAYDSISTRALVNAGTWYWRAMAPANGNNALTVFASSSLGAWPAGCNSYQVNIITGSGWTLTINSAGAVAALTATAGTCTAGVMYEHCVTRSAAGQFRLHVRGGIYTRWTLLGVATENTHWSNKYFRFAPGNVNCALGLSQPGNKQAGLFITRGILDPTLGELPVGAQEFTPYDLTGIVGLWLPDKGVTIETGVRNWEDIINGYSFRETTAPNQPAFSASSFNSRPGITFDGTNDRLTETVGLAAAVFSGSDQPYTVIMARQYVAVPAASKYSWNAYGGGSASIDSYVDGVNNRYELDRTDDAAVMVQRYGGVPDTNRHVVSDVFDGATITKYVDSVSVFSGAQDVGVCTLTSVSLGTKAGSSAGTYNANMRIAGLIVCRGALSSAERLLAEQWLAARAGV